MKNTCILMKKKITVEDGGEGSILEGFSRCGYPFEEIRILPSAEKTLRSLLMGEQEEGNLLLLAEKPALPALREIVRAIEGVACVSEYAGAGIYERGKKSIFLLSVGEEKTGKGYFEGACVPYLQKKSGVRYESAVLRAVGANEMRVRALLAEGERRAGGRVRFSHSRKYDEDILAMYYDENSPKAAIDSLIRLFVGELADSLYAVQDVPLEGQLVQLLKLRGKKLSVAESFTGGGIAKRITSVSGASEVYFEGINSYAEESKTARLGVSQYMLRASGAVSDQTAYEMALGLLNSGNCDVAIATTGLAGPNTDRSALPVGLCFIAVGTKEKIYVYRYKFDGDRREITEKAINYALFLAYKLVKEL